MTRIRNAEFRVTGPQASLDGFRELLLRALIEEHSAAQFEETVNSGNLVYRFATSTGLPFPAFAEASEAYPDLEIVARWEDTGSGATHVASIRAGTVGGSDARRDASGEPPLSVRMAADGTLILALCMTPASEGEPRLGCMVTADRDGMFLFRGGAADGAELLTTGDELNWSAHWVRQPGGAWDEAQLAGSRSFEPEHEKRLNELADMLLRDWLWYAEGNAADVAVEAERSRLYGFATGNANVRSAAVKRMARLEDGGREFFQYSNLGPDDEPVREALERCWLIG